MITSPIIYRAADYCQFFYFFVELFVNNNNTIKP